MSDTKEQSNIFDLMDTFKIDMINVLHNIQISASISEQLAENCIDKDHMKMFISIIEQEVHRGVELIINTTERALTIKN